MGINLHRYRSMPLFYRFSARYTTIQERKQNRNSDAQFTHKWDTKNTGRIRTNFRDLIPNFRYLRGEKLGGSLYCNFS